MVPVGGAQVPVVLLEVAGAAVVLVGGAQVLVVLLVAGAAVVLVGGAGSGGAA